MDVCLISVGTEWAPNYPTVLYFSEQKQRNQFIQISVYWKPKTVMSWYQSCNVVFYFRNHIVFIFVLRVFLSILEQINCYCLIH